MIGISVGDANGVGPEILLRAYKAGKMTEDFIAIGDFSVLNYCNKLMQLDIPLNKINELSDFRKNSLNIYDLDLLQEDDISIGQLSEKTGFAALKYVEVATQLAINKLISALVTLPVNKEAIRKTNPDFSGHTGYIAAQCETTNYTMMLISDQLIVSHVSTHVSQIEAINNVKQDRIIDVIRLTDAALKKIGKRARIAVAGLNPHAGENNAFGEEDSKEISPAVKKTKDEGMDVTGPVPADTVFYQAIKGNFDAVVCMYHDQGHIPIKLLAFESAVNVTLGLPIVRTSVDHGTAFDIAYQGIASTESFVNAFNLARKLIPAD
ncbi:MAG: 4-hydroxythreonine-4-phosphate dehydrogenase PdxA [Prolixibacteraceae bacterium]|jgi:4-phospho-D-threonate 3-dehydrogenase / 4-phospho-D-erythronate 3-dehydrogenase|nr:4-hydroxythreonine-4-phosphate dehydrogenase PdxA [Prolixibacteraceae bacterium]MBT6006400.1 4-hydroxythreonine-4-phosphate dehydrogenase PdxA [Prolixibacteraceae bacterium]MBT6764415.1 4-hydroxythreonine-4-phosphate dehydrogenase PdxA [Prolixibacteraceae bacterium]MBT6999848.1 4-hydroxythreonine-4-phosphate dehydrogenase PdxA [Prolixibacteraceae bacterium]MBT7395469.1 4-hydroxythreonine-4-phosphate dehydrogenase PdxA [Prolixibacteraceae bacterium]